MGHAGLSVISRVFFGCDLSLTLPLRVDRGITVCSDGLASSRQLDLPTLSVIAAEVDVAVALAVLYRLRQRLADCTVAVNSTPKR